MTNHAKRVARRSTDGSPGQAPHVSVVVPSLHQGAFLGATLRSVLDQGYGPLEILVVDGGSTDGTLEVLRGFGERIQWTSEPDAGQSDAINKGLRRARGQILTYLNSDDVLAPGAVAAAVAALGAEPGPAVVYGDLDVIDSEGALLYRLPAPALTRRRMVARGEYVPQPGTFWHRGVQEAIGLFDVGLHYAMDHDFFCRAAARFPLIRLPRTMAGFRIHGASKTRAAEDRMWREGLRVAERHGLRPWHAWYWIRRARHRGLRLLPPALQARVLRLAGRPDAELLENASKNP